MMEKLGVTEGTLMENWGVLFQFVKVLVLLTPCGPIARLKRRALRGHGLRECDVNKAIPIPLCIEIERIFSVTPPIS